MLERLKQLDRQTVILLVLAGLVGVLLFGAVVGGIRQAGWQEGYMVGLLAGGGEQAKVVAPYLAERGGSPGYGVHGYGLHGWGGHGFGFIGGFFRFLFFVFFVMLFFKFLRFLRWRMHGGPHWHHHPHGPWGHPHGPWGQQQWQPGQQPEQPQSGQGNPAAPSTAQPADPTPQPTSWVKV